MVDDQTLISLVQNGDEVAFAQLYKRHEQYVRAVVRRHLGAHDEMVDEVVQDVFFSLLEKLRYFRAECAFSSFLYTIARGKSIDVIRKKKVVRALHHVIPHSILAKMKSLVAPDYVERSEVEEKINVVLNALPRDYAVVIRLKYMEELSVEQIATDLGVSTKTIESRLFRARTSFKTLWTR